MAINNDLIIILKICETCILMELNQAKKEYNKVNYMKAAHLLNALDYFINENQKFYEEKIDPILYDKEKEKQNEKITKNI